MPSKLPRCPNGSRRKPPKTGKCVKNSVKKDVKKQKKTQKKTCPQGKILNPKTNRCINDNSANRKRLNLSDAKPKNGDINTIHCKKYGNIRDMDLNRLSVVVKPNSSGFSIDYSNNNRKFTLDDVTFLSSGSYGEVYKFHDSLHNLVEILNPENKIEKIPDIIDIHSVYVDKFDKVGLVSSILN